MTRQSGSVPSAARRPSTTDVAARTERFRAWLKDRIAHDSRSLHAVEVESGIPGNALGKFLRGERGSRHSLTPMNIQRLAPVLRIGEVELLFRAGHLTYEPEREPTEVAILASGTLDDQAKLLMLALYTRLAGPPLVVVER